jgi:hypothetical protein
MRRDTFLKSLAVLAGGAALPWSAQAGIYLKMLF